MRSVAVVIRQESQMRNAGDFEKPGIFRSYRPLLPLMALGLASWMMIGFLVVR